MNKSSLRSILLKISLITSLVLYVQSCTYKARDYETSPSLKTKCSFKTEMSYYGSFEYDSNNLLIVGIHNDTLVVDKINTTTCSINSYGRYPINEKEKLVSFAIYKDYIIIITKIGNEKISTYLETLIDKQTHGVSSYRIIHTDYTAQKFDIRDYSVEWGKRHIEPIDSSLFDNGSIHVDKIYRMLENKSEDSTKLSFIRVIYTENEHYVLVGSIYDLKTRTIRKVVYDFGSDKVNGLESKNFSENSRVLNNGNYFYFIYHMKDDDAEIIQTTTMYRFTNNGTVDKLTIPNSPFWRGLNSIEKFNFNFINNGQLETELITTSLNNNTFSIHFYSIDYNNDILVLNGKYFVNYDPDDLASQPMYGNVSPKSVKLPNGGYLLSIESVKEYYDWRSMNGYTITTFEGTEASSSYLLRLDSNFKLLWHLENRIRPVIIEKRTLSMLSYNQIIQNENSLIVYLFNGMNERYLKQIKLDAFSGVVQSQDTLFNIGRYTDIQPGDILPKASCVVQYSKWNKTLFLHSLPR